MSKRWRPRGWRNPWYKSVSFYSRYNLHEAGADAMLEAIWKLAKESPAGTFTFDSNIINIQEVDIG